MKTKYKKRATGIASLSFDKMTEILKTDLETDAIGTQLVIAEWLYDLSKKDKEQVYEVTGMTEKQLKKFVKCEGIAADHLLMLYILYKEQHGGEDAPI